MCRERRELVYVPARFYGYDIVCRYCRESYGFSSDRDLKYLAALNRNSERKAGKPGKQARRTIRSAERRPA